MPWAYVLMDAFDHGQTHPVDYILVLSDSKSLNNSMTENNCIVREAEIFGDNLEKAVHRLQDI